MLLDQVAKELSMAHEIFWIVQNKSFKPDNGIKYSIPYPDTKQLKGIKTKYDIDYESVIASDRQINFFEKTDTSYFYYYANKIGDLLLKIKPDFAFGEATAFHELLTVELCKKFDIQYLNPTTCRYPTGRFSFYNYASLHPYKGSNETLDKDKALEIIESITNRSLIPDYMKNKAISQEESFKDKIKKTVSYYAGEQFNTPSPFIKMKLERQKAESIKKWTTFSKSTIETSGTSILFPMHMQPESNIDVWGRAYRNQFKTIKGIYATLTGNQILYVKPNPKSKYELSNELIEFIQSHDKVIALRHDVPMAAIFDHIDLVATITGTVAIECILANKPVVTFVKTINNTSENCLYVETFEDLKRNIKLVEDGNFPTISEDQKIGFLNTLNKLSFDGVISDPYHDPNCVSKENVSKLVRAFENVIDNDVLQF